MRFNAETVTELCKHVNTLKDAVLGPIQEFASANPGSTLPAELDRTVETLTSELSQLMIPWGSFRGRGKFSRFISRDKDEAALREFAEDVGRALQTFQAAGAVNTNLRVVRGQARIELGVSEIRSQINAQEIIFLHQALPRAPDAGYDTNRPGAPSSSFKGTRVEILHRIMAWLERPVMDASRPIYWVNGLAGIGKSTIARTVAEQVNGLALPMASFFLVRHNDALSNAKLFVTSIAFRLAEIFPKFMESVSNVLKADGTLPSKPLDTQFTELFFQPRECLALNQPLILVVDALDTPRMLEPSSIMWCPTVLGFLCSAYSSRAGPKTISLLSSNGLIT